MIIRMIAQNKLNQRTLEKAPFLICEADQGFIFPHDDGDALCMRRFPESCVVIRFGSVVRVHYGTQNVESVLRSEYGRVIY